MDKEAWHAVDHGVVKSRTRLNNWTEMTEVAKLGVNNSFLTQSFTLGKKKTKLNCDQIWTDK